MIEVEKEMSGACMDDATVGRSLWMRQWHMKLDSEYQILPRTLVKFGYCLFGRYGCRQADSNPRTERGALGFR